MAKTQFFLRRDRIFLAQFNAHRKFEVIVKNALHISAALELIARCRQLFVFRVFCALEFLQQGAIIFDNAEHNDAGVSRAKLHLRGTHNFLFTTHKERDLSVTQNEIRRAGEKRKQELIASEFTCFFGLANDNSGWVL